MPRIRTAILHALLFGATLPLALPLPGEDKAVDAAPPESRERSFVQMSPTEQIPSVRAIAPIDGANVLFLNHRGQIGVAKFSPGLSQIGWELYTEFKQPALPFLALGPNYSVLTASPGELTQAFDTDRDLNLDFFQAVLRDWPGRGEGVAITAGPIADPHGRVLFALSPHPEKPGDQPRARLLAWVPALSRAVVVTESELPIAAFGVNRSGLLAARLSMPSYDSGYFLSLTELPAPDPENPGAPPATMPFTLPSLIIPAELTGEDIPKALAFFQEDGGEKILLACATSGHLVEVSPERPGHLWQGAILLRAKSVKPIDALVEMAPGTVLGGGEQGFASLLEPTAAYRIRRLALVPEGISLEFTDPVDRFEAVKSENFAVSAVALGGGESTVPVTPVVESDGRTVVLRTEALASGTVLRVVCQNLPSESGAALLATSAFYTVHER